MLETAKKQRKRYILAGC